LDRVEFDQPPSRSEPQRSEEVKSPCAPQSWDDGTPSYYWRAPHPVYDIYDYAQRFTVVGPETLASVDLLVYNMGTTPPHVSGNDDLIIKIWDDDGTGFPGAVLATEIVPAGTYPFYPDSTTVDFYSHGLVFEAEDFFVSFNSSATFPNDCEATFSDAETTPNGRAYANYGGDWWSTFGLFGIDVDLMYTVTMCAVPSDTDGDGVYDEDDNCPDTPNPDQADSNGDGWGDACQPDYAISLDSVHGLAAPGDIYVGPIKFDFRYTNLSSHNVASMTNGIRIFSPDNATWGPVTQDTVSLDWLGMFDLIVTLPEFSVTGSGADTLGLGGSVMMGTGLPPGFDEFSRWIQVETHVEDIGKTICIDSAFYPPSGAWYWNWSGRGSTVPEWSGPHCYTIVETTDVDGDGIPDHLDNCLTVFNPDQINSDNDSYGDACDNCPTVYNPDQMNSDNDSYGDACDNCPTVINPDQMNSDNDSYGDACDNCPTVINPDQMNSDNDSYGDACDNCDLVANEDQTNSDPDSHGDACDNCDLVANEDQTNSDTDSHGDACDNCDLVANEDQTNSDTDSHGDACDNCDLVANEDQTNSDTDSHGDACDNCDLVANEDQADYNDDGTGNACDCCAIRGDVDHGGESEPNITDLIYLVTYMFQGGPAPVCNDPNSPACPEHYYAETDIDGNGSCTPDITDLIYLVTYMFQKGPALVPCP
jgi:hypothetical protein